MMQEQDNNNPQKSANYGQSVARPIVLIGMMGAGKTRLGQVLAQKLDLPFYDSDAVIERTHNTTIAQYFEKYGEAAFRETEYETFERLMENAAPMVISAGGGAVTHAKTRDIITKKACAIWLEADVSTLVRRCAGNDSRPLLKSGDPHAILSGLLERRAPLYAELAQFSVRTDRHSIDDIIQTILNGLKQCK